MDGKRDQSNASGQIPGCNKPPVTPETTQPKNKIQSLGIQSLLAININILQENLLIYKVTALFFFPSPWLSWKNCAMVHWELKVNWRICNFITDFTVDGPGSSIIRSVIVLGRVRFPLVYNTSHPDWMISDIWPRFLFPSPCNDSKQHIHRCTALSYTRARLILRDLLHGREHQCDLAKKKR